MLFICSNNREPSLRLFIPKASERLMRNSLNMTLNMLPGGFAPPFDNLDNITWAWQQMYKDLINTHAPFRTAKVRQNSLPWVDRSIRKEMNTKFKLLKRCKGSPDTVYYWLEYKAQRNKVNKVLKKAEAKHWKDRFEESIDSIAFWKTVNASIGKSKPKQTHQNV